MPEDNIFRFKILQINSDPETDNSWATEVSEDFWNAIFAYRTKKVIAEIVNYSGDTIAEAVCLGYGNFTYNSVPNTALCFKWREYCGDGVNNGYLFLVDDGFNSILYRHW